MRSRQAVSLISLTVWAACSQLSPEPPFLADCNPLSTGSADCLYPFPTDSFTKQDSSSRTGLRLALPAAALPVSSRTSQGVDPSIYNHRDGFSAATSLYVLFSVPLDKAGLPGPDNVEDTLQAESPLGLLRADSGERIPLFAELDVNAEDDNSRQLLLLHPMTRLRPGTRYLAYVRELRQREGAVAPPLPAFLALRDQTLKPDSPRASAKLRQTEILTRLRSFGIPSENLQVAWDFTTGSDEAIHGRLLAMRDAAFAELARQPPPMPIQVTTSVEDPPETPAAQRLLRRVQATFTAPTFLDQGNGTSALPGLLRGNDAEPRLRGVERFPVAIHIPECVTKASGPVPVLLFGHGTWSTGAKELDTPYQRTLANRLCMVQVGLDLLGLSLPDGPYFFGKASLDWNAFLAHPERLQQAHVNLAVLSKLIRQGALDGLPELQYSGRSIADRGQVYYYGISEGAIQGATALALSPDIARGGLNVGCGFWSFYMWRSTDGTNFLPLLAMGYPDAADRQALLAIGQLEYDFTDPAHYAAHLLRDPLPGVTTKPVLYQEGLGDAAVPNLATRRMVRVMGLPLLQPGNEAVFDVSLAGAPARSAYVQYDVGVRPRPGADNRPPDSNLVHESIRRLDAVQEQLARFLRPDGQVQDTCGGKPCVFAPPNLND